MNHTIPQHDAVTSTHGPLTLIVTDYEPACVNWCNEQGFAYIANCSGETIWTRKEFEEFVTASRRFYDRVTDDAIRQFNAKALEQRSAIISAPRAPGQPTHKVTSGYVYLLSTPDGHYKIGKALDPDARLAQIVPKMPFDVTLEHWIKCEDYTAAEAMLHKEYAPRRVNGEWFKLSEGDVAFIKAIDTISAGGHYNE